MRGTERDGEKEREIPWNGRTHDFCIMLFSTWVFFVKHEQKPFQSNPSCLHLRELLGETVALRKWKKTKNDAPRVEWLQSTHTWSWNSLYCYVLQIHKFIFISLDSLHPMHTLCDDLFNKHDVYPVFSPADFSIISMLAVKWDKLEEFRWFLRVLCSHHTRVWCCLSVIDWLKFI